MSAFSLRAGFSHVPAWQIATSFAILVLCACGAVWLAGRAFRLGMLRYGQRVDWRELFPRAQMRAWRLGSVSESTSGDGVSPGDKER
jgi:hypothetical protein